MQSWFTEELTLLKESAERFVERDYGFERRQALAASETGFDRAVWSQFAELGWLAAPLPEAYGGLGGSALEVAVVMEALGKGLVLEPYIPTVVLGAGLVAGGGGEELKQALLPAVAAGELLLAFGFAEPQSRYDLADVATSAKRDGDGYRLSGRKGVVFHAATADKIIVSARTAGGARDAAGISLFILDRVCEGLDLRAYATVDGLRAAELTLDNVRAEAADLIGEPDGALPLIEQVVDHATVAVSAEAVGAMEVMLRSTQDYLKTREQFGVPIGSFQVLQHKVVDMFSACELSRALTYRAAASLGDASPQERARAASAMKVQIGKAGKQVGQDAIQLHGGMGMAHEMAVGHYFKRVSMIAATFGDTDFHLRRFAAGQLA